MKSFLLSSGLFLSTLILPSVTVAAEPPAKTLGIAMGQTLCTSMERSGTFLDQQTLVDFSQSLAEKYGEAEVKEVLDRVGAAFLSFDPAIVNDPYLFTTFRYFMLVLAADENCFRDFIDQVVLDPEQLLLFQELEANSTPSPGGASQSQTLGASSAPVAQIPVPSAPNGRPQPPHGWPTTTTSGVAEMALAEHLAAIGAKEYGAYWCPHCYNQKQLFGEEAFKEVPYLECDPNVPNAQTQACIAANIRGFPTWEINGQFYPGTQSLERLAELSGYEGPTNFKYKLPY